jgi:hypothetical protein
MTHTRPRVAVSNTGPLISALQSDCMHILLQFYDQIHIPEEEVLSAADAFQDADQSEARWQAFEKDEKLRRVLVELPEPAFSKLEKLALQRRRTVSHLVEEVITDLVDAFVIPEEKA